MVQASAASLGLAQESRGRPAGEPRRLATEMGLIGLARANGQPGEVSIASLSQREEALEAQYRGNSEGVSFVIETVGLVS